MGYYSFITH